MKRIEASRRKPPILFFELFERKIEEKAADLENLFKMVLHTTTPRERKYMR